jgi:signal transduction histidine kinase
MAKSDPTASNSLTPLLKVGWEAPDWLPEARTAPDAPVGSDDAFAPPTEDGDRVSAVVLQQVQADLQATRRRAAAAAHEVYQPLNAIKIIAQCQLRCLDQGRMDVETLREELEEVVRQVTTAATIVGEMRGLREATGEEPWQPIDVSAELRIALKQIREQVSATGLGVEFHIDVPATPRVCAPPGVVQRVVLNLLQNAVEALAQRAKVQGSIWLTSSVLPSGAIQIQVRDNAGGIPSEVAARVFEPFFTTKPGRGMGMGLCICQRLVDRCGGRLEFEVTPGEGTTFIVSLPTVEQARST